MADNGVPAPHPPLDALIATVPDDAVAAHLEGCPRCRLDARLARDAIDADPADLPDIYNARQRLSELRAEATLTFTSTLTESPTYDGSDWADDLRVGQRIDEYTVERMIGRGGMGSVYRIVRDRDGATFALKVLSSASRSAQRRLQREAEAQGQVVHPNVVRVLDVLDVLGAPGLVMEYVPGPTLKAWLHTLGAAPVAVADPIAAGIMNGLCAAHASGLVHRDLKPSNILLDPRDAGPPIPRIADFGLVRWVDGEPESRLTLSGVAMGTPAYMAPEQMRDAHRAGVPSDVFSLGAVLYELVTGRRAFPGTDMLDVYARIREGRYDPPDALVEGLPPRMSAAIEGALHPDAEERLPSSEAVLAKWRGEDRSA